MLCLACETFSVPLVNALSHISNLKAQHKIGSNFDISAAIFGSHLYRNVLPQKAKKYLDEGDEGVFSGECGAVPEGLANLDRFRVYMLDQKKGADTRKMVGSFLSRLQSLEPSLSEEFFSRSQQIAEELGRSFGDAPKMKAVN